jgi:hypothetical protein
MDSSVILYITDSDTPSTDSYHTVLSVQEILDETSETEYDDLIETLRTADIPTGTMFPLFDTLWKPLVLKSDNSAGLLELLVIYQAVDQGLADEVDKIVCNLSDKIYLRPIFDIASPLGIPVVTPNGKPISISERKQKFRAIVKIIPTSLYLLIDQVVGLILATLGWVESDHPENPDFVFFPYPGRSKSTRSVIDAVSFQYVVVLPSLIIGEILPNSDQDRPFDQSPIMCSSFWSIDIVRKQLIFTARLLLELLIKRQGQRELERTLSYEVGIDAPRSVQYAWVEETPSEVRGLLTAIQSINIYRRWDVEGTLVGGNSSRDRAILYIARKHGLKTYYVPHSITHSVRNIYTHHPETTMFVESEFAVDYLKEHRPIETLPHLVPLGRPYFENLLQHRSNDSTENGGTVTITLATQDQTMRARKAFAATLLNAIEGGIAQRHGVEVIIKTHPSETLSLYESLQQKSSFAHINNIEIREDALFETLGESDLVVTVNSNVGLESMIVGTPCACVTLFEPWIPVYPYAHHESVPTLTSVSGVTDFFEQLTHNMVSELEEAQEQHISESYVLKPNISNDIAEHIQKNCFP